MPRLRRNLRSLVLWCGASLLHLRVGASPRLQGCNRSRPRDDGAPFRSQFELQLCPNFTETQLLGPASPLSLLRAEIISLMQFTSVAYEAPWHIDGKSCLDISKNLKEHFHVYWFQKRNSVKYVSLMGRKIIKFLIQENTDSKSWTLGLINFL